MRVGTRVGYTGWVSRVAIPGTHRGRSDTRKVHPDSGAGPGRPCRGREWVVRVDRPRRTVGAPVRPCTHPPGPVGACSPSLVQDLPPRAKGRDSGPILVKLVKTAKCHQKVTKRPRLVPIFQNGLQKSPLEIPGFPFWPAFSPKELMGVFWP